MCSDSFLSSSCACSTGVTQLSRCQYMRLAAGSRQQARLVRTFAFAVRQKATVPMVERSRRGPTCRTHVAPATVHSRSAACKHVADLVLGKVHHLDLDHGDALDTKMYFCPNLDPICFVRDLKGTFSRVRESEVIRKSPQ